MEKLCDVSWLDSVVQVIDCFLPKKTENEQPARVPKPGKNVEIHPSAIDFTANQNLFNHRTDEFCRPSVLKSLFNCRIYITWICTGSAKKFFSER